MHPLNHGLNYVFAYYYFIYIYKYSQTMIEINQNIVLVIIITMLSIDLFVIDIPCLTMDWVTEILFTQRIESQAWL